ncbi:hypothetical protein LguiB_005716 [Lonicera macranthoides]
METVYASEACLSMVAFHYASTCALLRTTSGPDSLYGIRYNWSKFASNACLPREASSENGQVLNTGKTATFCFGILQQLGHDVVECQALVLAPIHELVQKIEKVMRALGNYLSVNVHACVGLEDSLKCGPYCWHS